MKTTFHNLVAFFISIVIVATGIVGMFLIALLFNAIGVRTQ
jgi:hypothetical protein